MHPAGSADALPTPLTPLVGRDAEVAAIAAALGEGGARLLTVTGAGGVGKSRVALAVAQQVAGRFPDGVRLLEAAPLADPALLMPEVARALGLAQLADAPSVGRVAQALGNRSVLLLVDDADRLAPHAEPLAELLTRCPGLVLLVTSRSRLRLRGEVVRTISPLPVPSPGAAVEALAANPAVRLFVERGQAVDPDVALGEANAADIGAIVRRLDGLPLAVELAAARLDLLSPAALLARLESRLPLLTAGQRDLPDRLRTMSAAIAWSYDLLAPAEQWLLERLAVFDDPVPLAGAVAVSGADDEVAVLDLLGQLSERSLLGRERGGQSEPRFRMLQTVREFARDRLRRAGDEPETLSRLADWVLREAEAAAAARERGGATPELIARMEPDEATRRDVLAWLHAAGETERFVRLAAALGWWWLQRSRREEGRRWLEAAVAAGTAAGGRSVALARALDGAAVLAFSQGDLPLARARTDACLALSRDLEDGWGVAAALNLLGAVARAAGDLPEAEARFGEAVAGFAALDEPGWVALATLNLGTVAHWQQRLDDAAVLMEEARQGFAALDDAYGLAIAANDLARLRHDRGERAAAADAFAESLARWRLVGTREGLVDWATRVAALAADAGASELSLRWFAAAETERATVGYALDQPERVRQRGLLERARLALGPERSATAWGEGRALPFAVALDEAAAWVEDLRAAPAETTAPAADPATRTGLTPREVDVLRLVVEGHSDRQIGDRLFISHRTVMRHVENILGKLEVESRTAAATLAVRQGFV